MFHGLKTHVLYSRVEYKYTLWHLGEGEDQTGRVRNIFLNILNKICDVHSYVPSNLVISSPFSHRTFFFTKFHEGTLYFFRAVNSLKKLFRFWHGHFWPWLTSKPLFFYSSSGDEITLLEGNFVSPLYPWTKT